MNISINPTYYCNFRCDFCYLTEEQLSNRQLIPLDILEERIKEAQSYYDISMVDLYGGEIGLLPESYINSMCAMLNNLGIDDINIITNLSMINSVILNPDLYMTVSYDFDCREQHTRVWDNMCLLTKPFSILILAGKQMIEKDVDDMIMQLNCLGTLSSVEIKPYSTNQANVHNVSHTDYENFVKKWIKSPIQKKFQFVNEYNINSSLDGTRNAFSNDHVYITPSGKFAVLEFDLNDNEYFKQLDTIEEYTKWAESEPTKNISSICKACDYYGKCLTEHYRYVKDLDNSCNGYINLLNWYKND
jgi:sulfatase maturation enzyme AslB (radical SAM superfamily)